MKPYPLLLASGALLMQGAALRAQDEKPNIIWITCEDISPYMSVYGDRVVSTSNIDRLADEGMRFQSVYTTAGVSAPSRSCIITGMYPMSIGTQHMRTQIETPEVSRKIGVPPYSAVLPDYVKAFPEYLRRHGYYTTNNLKTDYQFMNNPSTELLTNYGPISELWFDMGSHTPEQSREMYNLVHKLQPDCMVSGRLGNDAYDFSVMADNKYPESALQVAWQTAASMFDETWSYRSWQERGSAVDKAEEKLRSLLGVVSHGGNFLLNIGPKGDGSVVPFEREVLQRIGKWMGKYGEAIYETEASPYRQSFEWGYITRKGTKLYLIVSDDYKAGQVQIPMPADNKLLSARSLVGGNALNFTQEKDTYWIDTPAKEGDTYAVAELTFASEVEPMPMAALRKSGALVLSQENATPSYSYSCYDYYTNYRSTVAFNWETELKRALRSAEIIYTQQQSNRELSFSIDGESAGTITLNAGKPYDLKVKPGSVRMGAAKWQGPSFGLFDGNIADWAEKEGTPTEKSEGTIPTTILKNYFLTQEIESDKDQDVLFELRSGNGVEVVLNGQTFSKHLNPYRCTLRDEQLLLPLRKGKNTVVIRFYNRFEKEMPWRFALAEKQVVLKQDALVALPAGRHTLSVAPAQPRSIHADIELSDIKIIYK